ncbi:MAG TPA: type II secretion system protein [Tepidisphaeraceae bacterium]|jgi:prepilin-type N-terminal cleavage/methylation domain-containing protein/prepilin-type processing-associated H-X9-DG protein|nr:type II secretion system protein [Tepidisphaeraceae bacterium]
MSDGEYDPFPTTRRAFTLVELMVVIGIVAVLLGILLPMLGRAREHAQTAACMSNLRQLGDANLAYAMANDDAVVPMDYRDMTVGASANGFAVAESWATILVAGKYVPYPVDSKTSPPDAPSVFRCPTGSSDYTAFSNITSGLPTTRTDGFGSTGAMTISKTLMAGRAVYVWYGINGSSNSETFMPIKRIPPDSGKPTIVTHLSAIKKPSDVVFLFDGIAGNMQNVNANRLNARHNRQTQTNILFFDAHVETIPTADLPGGAGNAGNSNPGATAFSPANLAKYHHPLWRLDQ